MNAALFRCALRKWHSAENSIVFVVIRASVCNNVHYIDYYINLECFWSLYPTFRHLHICGTVFLQPVKKPKPFLFPKNC